ncbi:MAG: DNA recombination protein RmuC, partial [Ignavibacteriaceae bacterium]|nr:DNA recombination protein RmuC [Ignavibacteriaceae bacterium]
MELVFLFIGLFVGSIAAWFICSLKNKSKAGVSIEDYDTLKNEFNIVQNEKARSDERNKIFEDSQKQLQLELTEERVKVIELNASLSTVNANQKNLQIKLDEQKADIQNLQDKFTKEFENLASKIFEEKSTKFTLQNKENIDSILRPLNEKIKDFEKKVEEVYVNDSKERATLLQQIKTLHDLNQQMSKDATNLTNALKGQSKTQGNWGEFILENILEKSGLVKGREYLVQESLTTEDGKRFQPDVLINLPEGKTLIIDSKVSLNAYERYASADDENERASS